MYPGHGWDLDSSGQAYNINVRNLFGLAPSVLTNISARYFGNLLLSDFCVYMDLKDNRLSGETYLSAVAANYRHYPRSPTTNRTSYRLNVKKFSHYRPFGAPSVG